MPMINISLGSRKLWKKTNNYLSETNDAEMKELAKPNRSLLKMISMR
ncbi:MAG: hypothetical protein R3A12_04615 [Ignavibacteria bacterium]